MSKKILAFALLFSSSILNNAWAGHWINSSVDAFKKQDKRLENFKDLSRHDYVVPYMMYATKNNFTGENIYGNFNKPYAHYITDEKLAKANEALQKFKPGWKFKIYDALRPQSCQIKLWDKVKGTPQEGYVMNPKYGSIHSFGFALDLTLVDEKGNEVDMGTPVDSFNVVSQPRYEAKYLRSGELSQQQYDNRQVLRKSMVSGGFQIINNEWWHFEALPGNQVRATYPMFQ